MDKGCDLLKQVLKKIERVKGKSLNLEERRVVAVDLAARMLELVRLEEKREERYLHLRIGKMIEDRLGKVFTTDFTDQCFRSRIPHRMIDQLVYLLKKWGIPQFFSWSERFQFYIFRTLGNFFPRLFSPLTHYMVRKEMSRVIIPGEKEPLKQHMKRRYEKGVRVNLNHLGEAILGEQEALHRLNIYLEDLSKPEVEYISVKISTIYSQLNLLSWGHTIEILSERLRQLYRASLKHLFRTKEGIEKQKFVNLDMEEYRDLSLTIELFFKVLDEEEFLHCSAGIVLQSYLPDSFEVQKRLTQWSLDRVSKGGAPIKLRIVKGANLAMEQVEAALAGWSQAPYDDKIDVDANYKRMLIYACQPVHAQAVNIGIASHNLFDIAFALSLRSENQLEKEIDFEMLEGMAPNLTRVVRRISEGMLLYCPVAKEREFQNAVAYLIRRLDENTGPQNFLRHLFHLVPGTALWEKQEQAFVESCERIGKISSSSRRQQSQVGETSLLDRDLPFDNEPNRDWVIKENRDWIRELLKKKEKSKEIPLLPLSIGGEIVTTSDQNQKGEDPSRPGYHLYSYVQADSGVAERAIVCAEKAHLYWSQKNVEERFDLTFSVAQELRKGRGELIVAMVADAGKSVPEADAEVSEAIDFVEYYRRNLKKFSSLEDLSWSSKGIVLIVPPWNFPCAIPIGGIIAALLAGNVVIFKPAPEAVLVGWKVVEMLWKAGVPRDVLQFVSCPEEPVGSQLIKDPRISSVVLTGATSTAKYFMKMRPEIDLIAETGGKNAIIVTNMSDRDLAVKDAVYSAFGHSGQKCSAASLLICEGEVYDDPLFRRQLRDAAESLLVGSAWDLKAKITPLIHEPSSALKRALTTLEEGEEWLLQPKEDPHNKRLWSPGIKLGVSQGNFTHHTELFGPLLGVMRADNLDHAIELANDTPYGLTSGLHSLDDREQKHWMKKIQAGNCYINRGITGAIVCRQPFGGVKESSFGYGVKAGGPNFLLSLMIPSQKNLPRASAQYNPKLKQLVEILSTIDFSSEEKALLEASFGSYSFWWKYFSRDHDPSRILGQDNLLRYQPRKDLLLSLNGNESLVDVVRVVGAVLSCGASLEISGEKEKIERLSFLKGLDSITLIEEEKDLLLKRITSGEVGRMRTLTRLHKEYYVAAAKTNCYIVFAPVLGNGRIELLHYLKEISLSIDYHRYGNLGIRENEVRRALLQPSSNQSEENLENQKKNNVEMV